VVEVAVAAVAEAVAGHVDGRAEAPVVEQRGERGALAGVEQRVGDGEAVASRRSESVGQSRASARACPYNGPPALM
jgi:hypothetical protein